MNFSFSVTEEAMLSSSRGRARGERTRPVRFIREVHDRTFSNETHTLAALGRLQSDAGESKYVYYLLPF